jgi:hypothetical protein
MTFIRFLLCLVLCGLLGAAAGFFAVLAFAEGMDRLAGYVVDAGGLGTLAVAILAGLAWGLLAGGFSAARVRPLLGAVAASLALTLGGILLVLGLFATVAYAGLPAPPRIDGRRIAVAFEIAAPAEEVWPREAGPGWRVLVESRYQRRERQRAFLDWTEARRDGDWLLIPGRAAIGNPGPRILTLYCKQYLSGSARQLPLADEPSRAEMAWSDWQPSLAQVPGEGIGHCGYPLRYRLRFADEPQ